MKRQLPERPVLLIAMLMVIGCAARRPAFAQEPTCNLDTKPIAARVAPAPGGELRLSFLNGSYDLSPIKPQVRADLVDSRGVALRQSDTTIRFTALTAGKYVLRVQSIGYQTRIDTIRITATSGVALTLPLRESALDGCEGHQLVIPLLSPAEAAIVMRTAAIRAVHPASSSPLLVVDDDAHVASAVSKGLVNAKESGPSRDCTGELVPRCHWQPGLDTTAVRVVVKSHDGSTAVVNVQSFGRLRNPSRNGPTGFFSVDEVSLRREGNVWIVTRLRSLLES
ncbi:MAG TPA: hypothetical protein VEB19_10905 [Gemmatimonadaceae bacterium]|nr:hypothetical protein [Gemmatimonadaceae bacterium]